MSTGDNSSVEVPVSQAYQIHNRDSFQNSHLLADFVFAPSHFWNAPSFHTSLRRYLVWEQRCRSEDCPGVGLGWEDG